MASLSPALQAPVARGPVDAVYKGLPSGMEQGGEGGPMDTVPYLLERCV